MNQKPSKLVLVTEGEQDLKFIEAVIPALGLDLDYVGHAGSGGSSTLAAVHTLLRRPEKPRVLLVVDADTYSVSQAQEKADFIFSYLKVRNEPNFKLYMALPSIESLFFLNREALEKALQVDLSHEMWELGKAHPRKALEMIQDRYHLGEEELLADGGILSSIAQGELIQIIRSYSQTA